jgi:hypothetical protein
MMSRPTTEQIILDCVRELMEEVLPSISEPTVQMRVYMMETVLRSVAARSANEVAWMLEESEAIEAYVEDVYAALPSDGLAGGLAALADAPSGFDLEAVSLRYGLATEALSLALESAVEAVQTDLAQRGEALLQMRLGHERLAMAGWDPVGR